MNWNELRERQDKAKDAVLERFLDGSRSIAVQATVRERAIAAIEARQAEEYVAAVAAEMKKMTAPEADDDTGQEVEE